MPIGRWDGVDGENDRAGKPTIGPEVLRLDEGRRLVGVANRTPSLEIAKTANGRHACLVEGNVEG